MTDGAVVVGPITLTGPVVVAPEPAAVALECIDDDLALVDDNVRRADDVWRDVLGRAVNGAQASLVVIHPSWWATARVERVRIAALAWSANVVMRARSELLPAAASVELAPELVVVHTGAQRRAIARAAGLVDAVVACLDGAATVTVDVPTGLTPFGAGLAKALRGAGVEVTIADDRALLLAAAPRDADRRGIRRRVPPRVAATVAVLGTACALAASAVAVDDGGSAPEAWLVEGRVAVEMPARWTVERITSGPGSARVQVVSPDDRADVIHLTQSRVPETQTLDEAAVSLRAALAAQPDGIFTSFTAPAERALRPAITYRETRAGRIVDWTVLLDGGVRIAIGCQGAQAGGPCERAIRSAHAVDRK